MQDWQLVILHRLLCTQLMIKCTSCDAGKPVSIDHNRGEGVASFIHPLQWRQSSFILNLIIHQNMHASVTSYYNSCTHKIQFIIRLAPHAFSICLVIKIWSGNCRVCQTYSAGPEKWYGYIRHTALQVISHNTIHRQCWPLCLHFSSKEWYDVM